MAVMARQESANSVPQFLVVRDHRSTISAVVDGGPFESTWLYPWAYGAGIVEIRG